MPKSEGDFTRICKQPRKLACAINWLNRPSQRKSFDCEELKLYLVSPQESHFNGRTGVHH